MSSDRMGIARNLAGKRIEENPNIIVAIVTGSTARNDDVETSDIDIRLLVDDTAGMEPKYSGIQPGQDGVFLDVEYVPAAKFGDPAEILRDPYLAGAVRDAAILFDKNGEFTEIQKIVMEQFMEPRWLRERISSLMPSIQRNFKEFSAAVREDNAAEICRSSIFALWTICDALLVRHGISSTMVRGLQKLGEVLPLERDRIMGLEGSLGMQSDEVLGFFPLLEQAIGVRPASMFFQHVQNGIGWLVQNGLCREAFHSLWIVFGLALKGHMDSDETKRQRKAQSLARSWLTEAEWYGEGLESKEKQLGEYVNHICQIMKSI